MRQVIKCGHLFDVNEKRFREQANVYIEGNEIVKVEYGAAGPEEGWEVVDLSALLRDPSRIPEAKQDFLAIRRKADELADRSSPV